MWDRETGERSSSASMQAERLSARLFKLLWHESGRQRTQKQKRSQITDNTNTESKKRFPVAMNIKVAHAKREFEKEKHTEKSQYDYKGSSSYR